MLPGLLQICSSEAKKPFTLFKAISNSFMENAIKGWF
jgi:hypothetical protein